MTLVSATRYFTGALVAESCVNVAIPALHGRLSPVIEDLSFFLPACEPSALAHATAAVARRSKSRRDTFHYISAMTIIIPLFPCGTPRREASMC